MVDPKRVQTLLQRLESQGSQLRLLTKSSGEELRSDRVRLSSAKYELVVAVEICIDTAHHIISSEALRAPENFADAFAVLGEVGYLEEPSLSALQDMARFRNPLIHEYVQVDDDRVIEILQTRLDDFDAFIAQIAKRALDRA